MKSVITVIVTYNRKKLLSKVLDSVLNQDYPIKKILIIDNDSSDGTKDMLSDYLLNNDVIQYHNTGGNLGGAGGFKYGFEQAIQIGFDYLWLMDDDLSPNEGCLSSLVKHNDNGITQPLRLNKDGSCAELSPLEYNLSNPFLSKPSKNKVLDIYPTNNDIILVAGVPFEGPLIAFSVVEKVGLPDDRFFIFYDDMDYSIRAKKAGFSICCVQNAKATRLLVNNQSSDLNSWKGYYMMRNLFHLHYKHGTNIFVKSKPVFYTFILLAKALFSMNFKQCSIVLCSFRDSFKLSNSHKFRP